MSKKLGTMLIFAGFIYLSLPVIATAPFLSTVTIGEISVIGISEFSALNLFIGFSLVAIGIFLRTRRYVLGV